MNPAKEQVFFLEDIPLRVTYTYDEHTEEYYAILPDLEESPIYTGAGRRCVTAVQDACAYGKPDGEGRCLDCGSCRSYRPATPGKLIGVCTEKRNQK